MVAGCIGANGERAGTRTLAMLAAPLNAAVLDALAQGPRRLVELREETGSPPQTTLRGRLRELAEVGAVEKRRLHPFPSVREHVLTRGAGGELRFVAATLEQWLAAAPAGPLPGGGESARQAVKALVDGWSATIVQALAAAPLTAAELEARIEGLGAPALERRLAPMREAGLVEVGGPDGRRGAHAATDWLRHGAAPLAAAIRWERRHLPEVTPPIAPLDAEAGFLLALPLLRLPPELSGSCRLGVDFTDSGDRRLAGVTAVVEEGRIASATTRLQGNPDAWATGPPPAWLRVAIEADPGWLELGGDRRLVAALVDGLNRALFPPAGRLGH